LVNLVHLGKVKKRSVIKLVESGETSKLLKLFQYVERRTPTGEVQVEKKKTSHRQKSALVPHREITSRRGTRKLPRSWRGANQGKGGGWKG